VTPNHFNPDRFLAAQEEHWDAVRAELLAGRKTTHWIWFIFPQLAALGRSATAKHYGLSGLDEATQYLAHPLLGPRLREACRMLLALPTRDPAEVLGQVDAMKLRSCLTLFAVAAPREQVFAECLDRFYGGQPDSMTLQNLPPQPRVD